MNSRGRYSQRKDSLKMDECVNLRQDLQEIKDLLLEILAKEEASGKTRKKRSPSKYNIFIGKCMKEGKGMKQCALEYKKKKELGLE